MPGADPRSRERPELRSFSVQALLEMLADGALRVPPFHRGFRWSASDSQKFFDSIVRGYPVGSLLFWHRPAPTATLSYGSVEIQAEARPDALWVLDGQQRIHCLARVLLGRGAPGDEFALYYDLADERVTPAPRHGAVPDAWLPLSEALDEVRLFAWASSRRATVPGPLLDRAFRLGRDLRDFTIPAYAIRTSEESTAREIFHRLNSSGKHMETHEVFDALHGAVRGTGVSRMSSIARVSAEIGFGALDERLLYSMLQAIRGEPSGSSIAHLPQEQAMAAYHALEQATRGVVVFLREDAQIPHISVLPSTVPLLALARFFSLHPQPSARSRELLSRWIWRDALTGSHRADAGHSRSMIAAIGADEHRSVQELLRQVSTLERIKFELADFSCATARGKLLVLALLDLGPLHLETGSAVGLQGDDYGALLQTLFSKPAAPHSRSLANRLLHPKMNHIASVLANVGEASILASHGVTREAQELLRRGDRAAFLRAREEALNAAAADLFARRARWDEPDDLPIHALVVDEED